MLREHGRGRPLGLEARAQLADLLVQAGRGEEAVPLLIGLADDHLAEGLVTKAVAALKRVEALEPGRTDVHARRSALAHAPAASPPLERPSGEAALAPPPEDPQAARPDDAEAAVDAARDARSGPEVEAEEPVVARVEDVADEPPPAAPADENTGPAAAPAESRFRRALRRFLSALPGRARGQAAEEQQPAVVEMMAEALPEAGAPEPPAEPAAPAESTAPSADAALPEGALEEVWMDELLPFADDAVGAFLAARRRGPGPGAGEASGSGPGAAPAGEAAPMSADAFDDAVLDLGLELVRTATPPAPPDLDQLLCGADAAARLRGVPLFADLAEDETLALLHGLRLRTFEPGDVVLTEGERGDSLGILVSGVLKVFVRNPGGRNFEVARLRENDLFGEIAGLSRRARTATLAAAAPCTVLELDRQALETLAAAHPRVRDTVERLYLERAQDPGAAAVRALPLGDAHARRDAREALEAYFGQANWDPRLRLHLAGLLAEAGREEAACAVLSALADDLAREGYPAKALAVLKRLEALRRRHVAEIHLAPRPRAAPPAPVAPLAPAPNAPQPAAERHAASARSEDERFHAWLLEVLRGRLSRRAAAREPLPALDTAHTRAYAHGLHASPLFESLSEDELLELMRGLRLRTAEPGDVIVTEGERGQGLFVLAAGAVKVFARDAAGRSAWLARLEEGAFFGEIATLSGRPRTATVTAATHCELLELDRAAVDDLTARHPRVHEVLQAVFRARSERVRR